MGGRDKSRLLVEGLPIIERQLAVLSPRFEPIAMIGGKGQSELTRIADAIGGQGPLDGLAAALRWAPASWLLLVASDQPFLRGRLLEALLAARQAGDDLVIARAEGRDQPMPGLYHRRILPAVEERLARGELALTALARPGSGLRVRLLAESTCRQADPELASFQNLNRLEDLYALGQ